MIFDIKSVACVGSWVNSDHYAQDKQVTEPQQFVTFKRSMNNSLCNWQGNWVEKSSLIKQLKPLKLSS